MKTILFPTAYSLQSKVAFQYAQKLAQYFDASIILLHVYKRVPFFSENEDPMLDVDSTKYQELLDYKSEEELKKLKNFASEMQAKQFQDIPLDFIAAEGKVVDEIQKVIAANDIDLIIMGMRKQSVIEKIFGSTAFEIIDAADCPLLLIPPTARYLGINKITYGTAFQVGDEKAIDYLFDWCAAFDSKLHLLHVHQKNNKLRADDNMEKLMANYSEETSANIVSFKLLEGKIQEALVKYIQFSGADILAIHKRKKGFWQRIREGNLTHILAEDSVVPLLILN